MRIVIIGCLLLASGCCNNNFNLFGRKSDKLETSLCINACNEKPFYINGKWQDD